MVKPTQYKKLAPNALRFTYHLNLKSCKSHGKDETKNIRPLIFSFSPIVLAILMFFVLSFHVVWKISNFSMWTAKHLVQASCTELTLNLIYSERARTIFKSMNLLSTIYLRNVEDGINKEGGRIFFIISKLLTNVKIMRKTALKFCVGLLIKPEL